MSMEAGSPALALIFLLGMRHGLEPDHLAAVDGRAVCAGAWRLRAGHRGRGRPGIKAITPSPGLFGWLEWLPIALLLLIAGPMQRGLGAFDGARLVGFAGLRREPLRQLWHKALLWGVFVDVLQRGKGVARRLVNACIEQANGPCHHA